MSKTLNMVGGGSKNISFIIITGLYSTDTVTCAKDGKTYPAKWNETTQHWEIGGLPLGTFIVTATRGTYTITETVLIDIAGVYEIEMIFSLYLYKMGDQCEDITGGWSAGWSYGGGGSISMNSDHFTVRASYGQNAKGCETNQKVSIEDYSVLKAEIIPVNCTDGTTAPNELWLYAIDTRGTWDQINMCVKASHVNQSDAAYKNLPLGETAIIIYDISTLTGSKYVGLASYGGETWKVNRVWLE